jgi:hypothetical protein
MGFDLSIRDGLTRLRSKSQEVRTKKALKTPWNQRKGELMN